jgi:ABC-type multidrug transport system fused ATPase/permease subunit
VSTSARRSPRHARRSASSSLALAERRPDDLKAAALKLGQTPPSNRQLLILRLMGLIAPPASAGLPRRIGGILLIVLIVVVLLAVGWGIVQLIALPFGGINPIISIFWGLVLIAVVIGVLAFFGRRRQKAARAKAVEQRESALGSGRAARRSK